MSCVRETRGLGGGTQHQAWRLREAFPGEAASNLTIQRGVAAVRWGRGRKQGEKAPGWPRAGSERRAQTDSDADQGSGAHRGAGSRLPGAQGPLDKPRKCTALSLKSTAS